MSMAPSLAVALRYRDVAAASDWLCTAFGFQQHFMGTSQGGAVDYAQLTFGDAMLLLAPVRDFALDKYMKQPDEIGGTETQSCYLTVSNADAHYARAKAFGAEIILDIQDDDTGGRSYSCRDLEGHIWSFGTYDPWQGKQLRNSYARPARGGARQWVVVVGLLATIVASVAAATAMYSGLWQPGIGRLETRPGAGQVTLESVAKEAEELTARAMQERVSAEQRAREAAEREARETSDQLQQERIAKETAERVAEQLTSRIGEEQRARETAEHSLRDLSEELGRVRGKVPEGMERTVAEMREQLDRGRTAKEIADRTAEHATQRAVEDHNARVATERAVQEMREQLDRERAAKEAAERNLEQVSQRASEQQSAIEAAGRSVTEAREQVSREQVAKNAALRTAAQLRRQLNQVQGAQEPASADNEGKTSAPKARPKRKQKGKAPSSQE
jgi:uncharacterized glyoxalase superfamily protein PhnB